MPGGIESLNVAMACTALLYEAVRQRMKCVFEPCTRGIIHESVEEAGMGHGYRTNVLVSI